MTSLSAKIKLINQVIKFSCSSENYPEIITDYYPPLGKNEGYKSLQLFFDKLWHLPWWYYLASFCRWALKFPPFMGTSKPATAKIS